MAITDTCPQLQMSELQKRLDAEFLLAQMCSVKFKDWIVVLATLLQLSEIYQHQHHRQMSCPAMVQLLSSTLYFKRKGCVRHKEFTGMPEPISSPTLKRLSVYYDSPIDVYDATSMSFDLQNLVYLEYSDCALAEYMQVNLDSLVEAKLDLDEAGNVKRRDVTNLVTGIRNVEILHLSPASVDRWSSGVQRGFG
ncbi:PREDICTED: F-box/LRR-repeat protein At3g60040-like [Camelina sativa]|uniref:F-box/LRR-repeat protein At3g60040-like n=1 Tax=Camelina sativa TaxID=90675 RepID=A0ABM1R2G4_CAMSA|nr:PREDICTED: F-box/LRR-repeat protein At3g60040-like [Camelina sativa]